MPNDNRTQGPSNDAPRDPLDDLIAPILGRDVSPEPRNVPTLRETPKKSRRNPLDDLVTDAELRAETGKAAARSLASNQGRRNPLDDLLTDADLRTQALQTPMLPVSSKERVRRTRGKRVYDRVLVIVTICLFCTAAAIVGETLFGPPNRWGVWNQQHSAHTPPADPSRIETPAEKTNPNINDDKHGPDTPFVDARIIQRKVMKPEPELPRQFTSKELFKMARPAVVKIIVSNSRSHPIGHGTGFFVRDDSTVVTNFHVIDAAHSAFVLLEDGTIRVVLGARVDSTSDVAVLNVAGGTSKGIRPLTLGPKTPPDVGTKVCVIGFPEDLGVTNTNGEVTGLEGHRERTERPWIQIDAKVRHGNSGSPVIGEDGSVLGVATFIDHRGADWHFASPVSAVESLLTENTRFQPLTDLLREKEKKLAEIQVILERRTTEAIDEGLTKLLGLPDSYHQLPDYWLQWGMCHAHFDRWGDARTAYFKALEKDAEDAGIWYRIGTTHQHQNQHKEAEEAFRNGIKVDPNEFNCWRGLGVTLMVRKRLVEAEDALRRCVFINEKDSWGRIALGDVLAERGDIAGGDAQYKIALSHESDDFNCNFNYGLFLQRTRQYRESIAAFEKARTLAGDSKQLRTKCEGELERTRSLNRLRSINVPVITR